ncbi:MULTISPECIES: hypothetical protein [unclassified Corynebacterium]|uniref:hypothetical protein n=1 Tax=unclassified Corynebacterium TaxID=2624378 RepID=UPI0029CA15B2|nr:MULTISPECIES: hypothetical protein [unclassified Corynebacterium]WPF65447.1 hypothetical protein OLX12_07640 [Corynebacterium sp. 22KM0430]WPF67943.1 hypothetical protein OLW90_07635 [Corynebacterium sp. 21KM1197]
MNSHSETSARRSRDMSMEATTGSATALLERDGRRNANGTRTAPAAPRRTLRNPVRRVVPKPAVGRLGSRQVVSVRGRRVATARQSSRLTRISLVAIVLLVGGVALAMALSGISTQQTFRLQQLTAQEKQLDNQIETLNRDVETARSSSEFVRHANDNRMVVPQQPGILAVEENGEVTERRPAEGDSRPIVDVNGAPTRANAASSNPDKTEGMGENLEALPQGQQAPQAGQTAPAPQPPAGGQAQPPYLN